MPPQLVPLQLSAWLPRRPQTAHKGVFGRVLVVAGSRTMCGAGFLCAKSTLTAGAGLVYWALPASMQPAFAAALPEAITFPLPETPCGEIAAQAWEILYAQFATIRPSLVVVGPGMGNSPLLPRLLTDCVLPLVVDADALNALSRTAHWHNHWPKQRPCIFTPHAAEMARLLQEPIATDEPARQAQVERLANLTGGVGILKGSPTWVMANLGGQLTGYKNHTGGPTLAKGGSGDVLSGVIAGLWAQLGTAGGFTNRTAFRAAACAVYLHGTAGDLAARQQGPYSVLARDIMAHLPQAFLQTENL